MSSHILPMERWKFVCYSALAFLLAPIFFVVTAKRRFRFKEGKAPRVLIIPIMTRVGDLVCATASFRALKLALPASHLSVIAGKKVIDVVRSNKRIDLLVNLNDIPFKGFFGRGRLFRYLYSNRFDYVVSLTNNPFNNLVAFFSFAPWRIKTTVASPSIAERLTNWMTNRYLLFSAGSHLPSQYVNLLGFLGVPFTPPVKEVFPTREGEAKAEAFFKERGVASSDLVIGITVSAGNAVKEWPEDRFAALADHLVNHYGAKIIFLDSAGNSPKVTRVIGLMKEKEKVFPATDFSLAEVPSLVRRLKVFIAVDTGLIYVADALGIPLIDIIGPFDAREQAPVNERSVWIVPEGDSGPSLFTLSASKDEKSARQAVLSITVDKVTAAFADLFKRVVAKN